MRIALWAAVPALLLFRLLSVNAQTCDIYNDICPYPLDNECDAGGVCPLGTDCFDCDPCQGHNLDCQGCVTNGCYWCPSDGICISQPLGETFWSGTTKKSSCTAESEWTTECTTNPDHVFSDPLYGAQQWAYQLLNVEDVWREGITGQGVMIRVNDPDGVAVDHAEFDDRFREDASCSVFRPLNYAENTHGTAVASLAVGGSDNGECAVGIAPGAFLSACLGPTELTDANAAAFFRDGWETTHISVNSWGFDACYRKGSVTFLGDDDDDNLRFLQESTTCPFISPDLDSNPCVVCEGLSQSDCETYVIEYCAIYFEAEYAGCAEFLDLFVGCEYNTLSDVGQAAITLGVTEGRDGKGIIYVFASGNERDIWEDVNMEGWLNSRFTITVGAVDKEGKHASYSTGGAALFISGPGGDFDSLTNNIVASPGGGCVDATVGTSFATPSVAGAIALLLEANPNLGWRDVQGIIAATAQKVDAQDPSWTTNGAGLHHSNLFGFGVMDAFKAVQAAKTWVNFGFEKQIVAGSGPVNVAIADDASNTASSTITINETGTFTTESVVVYLQLVHESRGDLEVVLTSPNGTQSLLHPPLRPENQHLQGEERWKLMTVRNYGESPAGDWQLTLTDHRPGNLGECIDLPFLLILELQDGSIGFADCASIEAGFVCVDGTVFDEEVYNARDETTGRTATEACCACGGGIPASDVNALISWRLVIYGHGEGGSEIEVEPETATETNGDETDEHTSSTSGAGTVGMAWLLAGAVSFLL